MLFQLKYNLPFITLIVEYNGNKISIPSILIDTGSASTILSADLLNQIGIVPEPNDVLMTIRGVGGTEVVYRRKLHKIILDNFIIPDFEVEIGAMDYGFEINGILGMDFLLSTGCTINLSKMEISFNNI